MASTSASGVPWPHESSGLHGRALRDLRRRRGRRRHTRPRRRHLADPDPHALLRRGSALRDDGHDPVGHRVAAGAAGAILGLGGGILLIPILTLFYGVDLRYAMGASIVSVIATSSGAAAAYLRTHLSNVRIGLFLTLATVSGALVGAGLAGVVPVRWLQILLGLALAYSAITTLRQLRVEIPEQIDADPLALRFG